jgi:hypothetical protein
MTKLARTLVQINPRLPGDRDSWQHGLRRGKRYSPRHAALSRASHPIHLRQPRNRMERRHSKAIGQPSATTTKGGMITTSSGVHQSRLKALLPRHTALSRAQPLD